MLFAAVAIFVIVFFTLLAAEKSGWLALGIYVSAGFLLLTPVGHGVILIAIMAFAENLKWIALCGYAVLLSYGLFHFIRWIRQ